MATTAVTGQGILIPWGHYNASLAPSFGSAVFDATGDKVAMCGRVWFSGRTGTKDIRRIQFRFGSVTKAGGSALTVSLQNVDAANGPVIRPDGTQDQTVAIANADAGFASNAWYRTGTLSADRTVSFGELLSVVWEFDGGGRLGADAVNITGLALSSGVLHPINHQGAFVNYDGATWTNNNIILNVVLEFSDGTYGTLQGSIPASAVNSHAFNSGSTPDEYAMKITPEFEIDVDGIGAAVAPATSADFDMVFYSGTTAEATVSIDQNATISTSVRPITVPIALENLASGSDYYVAVKPTTANNVTVYSFDVNDAAFLDLLGPFGNEMTYATRTDAGAWSETTTRRLFAWAQLAGVPSAAGGAGAVGGGVIGLHGIEAGVMA